MTSRNFALGTALTLIGVSLAHNCLPKRDGLDGEVLKSSNGFTQFPLSIEAKLDGCVLSIKQIPIAEKLSRTPGSRMEFTFSAFEYGDLGGLTFNNPKTKMVPGQLKKFML